MLHIVHRAVGGFLVKRAGLKRREANTSAVTLIQRFGSVANLNMHLRCLVLDEVYQRSGREALFHEVRAPIPSSCTTSFSASSRAS